MSKKIDSACDCCFIHEEKKNKAVEVLKSINIFQDLSNFFKNFGDETRLKILTVLDRVESMCVCDIAVALDMTKSAISHQLKYLKDFNLIRSKKEGKIVFYSLADGHVKDIIEKGLEHLMEADNETRI